jgi:hypothetical protein
MPRDRIPNAGSSSSFRLHGPYSVPSATADGRIVVARDSHNPVSQSPSSQQQGEGAALQLQSRRMPLTAEQRQHYPFVQLPSSPYLQVPSEERPEYPLVDLFRGRRGASPYPDLSLRALPAPQSPVTSGRPPSQRPIEGVSGHRAMGSDAHDGRSPIGTSRTTIFPNARHFQMGNLYVVDAAGANAQVNIRAQGRTRFDGTLASFCRITLRQ